jgi:hypothetical protein
VTVTTTTLFLHKDWSHLSSAHAHSQEYKDLCSRAQKVIGLTPKHPRVLSFVTGWFLPILLLFYVILDLINGILQLSLWRVGYFTPPSPPCFFQYQVPGFGLTVSILRFFGSGTAVLGLFVGVSSLMHSRLGRSYFSFVLWWGRRSYGLLVWSLLSGFTIILAEKNVRGVTDILIVPIVAGLDLLIFLNRAKGFQLYRIFFALNALNLSFGYLYILALRNRCYTTHRLVGNTTAQTFAAIFNDVVSAGYLIALLKVLVRKVRDPYPPALRYGIASHVQVAESLTPGTPTALILEDRSITVTVTDAPRASFTFPNLAAPLTRWAALSVIWAAFYSADVLLDASLLRVHLKERCWTKLPTPPYAPYLTLVSSALAAVAILSLLAIIVSQKLGLLTLRWMRYWFRQNWILMLLCALRGCDNIRPGRTWSLGALTFINVAVFLPVALSTLDLLALLKPPRVFLRVFKFLVVAQAGFHFISYISGQAHANLCVKPATPSTGLYFLGKLQTAVLLIFSLQFAGMLILKLAEGVSIPMITLSSKGRFTAGSAQHDDQVLWL